MNKSKERFQREADLISRRNLLRKAAAFGAGAATIGIGNTIIDNGNPQQVQKNAIVVASGLVLLTTALVTIIREEEL